MRRKTRVQIRAEYMSQEGSFESTLWMTPKRSVTKNPLKTTFNAIPSSNSPCSAVWKDQAHSK